MRQIKDLTIYFCGGFTNLTFDEYNSWRVKLKTILEDANPKIHCINPGDYFSLEDVKRGGEEVQVRAMKFDLHTVRHSGLLICNFNAPKSLGTMAEMAIAYDRRIPIVGLNTDHKEIHPWSKNMCEIIFDNMEDLVLYVLKYYTT